MKKDHVFVSYTIRDGYINFDFLLNFSNSINPYVNVFIDLIHNNSADKQSRVVEELNKSDMIFLLSSESIKSSEWVKFELEYATIQNIPVFEIKVNKNFDFQYFQNLLKKYLPKIQNKANPALNSDAKGFRSLSLPPPFCAG